MLPSVCDLGRKVLRRNLQAAFLIYLWPVISDSRTVNTVLHLLSSLNYGGVRGQFLLSQDRKEIKFLVE
jgi:hypothetical protein